ncbi:MAG: AAA family ATPase [Chloroflexi bacterium]|nr:AAA family ATPase [Chloroflexota bacterium]
MISRVCIQNFKSIGEPGVDLDLKPLTLLVGPNGGGKSSILEAIAVAIQENHSGTLTDFRKWEAIFHKPVITDSTTDLYFASEGDHGKYGFRFTYDVRRGRVVRQYLQNGEPTGQEDIQTTIQNLKPTENSNAFMLGSVRGDVPYSANTGANPNRVGAKGENLLLMLAIIFGQRQHRNKANAIARWARHFGISDLTAGLKGPNESGSDYVDRDLKVVLDLALSSSGARQILTVITELFWAPENSLLMIEEPEISLHPQAQIDVLEMFAEAVTQDKKQIIATTHSHIMLQALGYAVHKGWLERDDIAVYHVEKGKAGTKAKLLPLGKQGYIKGWVPSYTKVERQLMREWAKTLPKA